MPRRDRLAFRPDWIVPMLDARALPTPRQAAAWVPLLARFGYAAKGVVYLLVGYVAAKAALAAGKPKGAAGALGELVADGGHVVVLVIAVGLLAHVLWRLVQALLDPEHRGERGRAGARLFYLVSGAIYGSLAYTAFKLSNGRAKGDGASEENLAATLLAQPFGPWLVGALGLGVLGYGLHQIAKGFRGDVTKHLGIADPAKHRAVVAIGRFGTAARGVVFAIMGTFFIDAARHHNPDEAGGTGDALRWLGQDWLLAIIAIGLMAYGLLQLAKVRYRHIAPPR